MMSEEVFLINNIYYKSSDAKISVEDLGLLRGFGVFDFTVTKNEKPIFFDEHIKRLVHSAQLAGIKIPWSIAVLKNKVLNTIKKNPKGYEKSIRIIITGGVSKNSITPPDKPTLIIIIKPRHCLPKKLYQHGANIKTEVFKRTNPTVKGLNYSFAVKTLNQQKKHNIIEIIYVEPTTNKILEGTTSNIFIVRNKIIYTPKTQVLYGITRKAVINLAKANFRLFEKDIKKEDLYSADEVFLTASNKDVLPITNVDGKAIGNGKPGSITKKIMEHYLQSIDKA